MYRWSMMKNIHSPNYVGIGSWGPEIWPHEYLISPTEISVNWSGSNGPPWTNSRQIWCVWGFFIMFYWNIVMKMLKCKKENLMTSHFSTLLIDLDLWNAFCEVSSWGSFLFTLQRQKKECTLGDEAIMKIHKKLFSGIPINFTLFVISPKLQRIWSWNFGFATRKLGAFIWYQKMPWGMRMWSA